jgi:hypothetical protein
MPITQETREGQTYQGSWWYEDPVNGKVDFYSGGGTVSWTNTRTGTNLPGFRNLIANSQDATTAFSGTKWEMLSFDPGYFDVTLNVTVSVPYYPWTASVPRTYSFEGTQQGVFFSGDVGNPSAAEQLALTGLYKRIRREHQSFSGLTFLGELREAVSMIRRPAKSLHQGLTNYISALKRRSRGVPYSKTGNLTRKRILSETWLEFSFGWQPLISDVKSGAEALARWKVGRDGFDERRSRISAIGEDSAATSDVLYGLADAFFPVRVFRNLSTRGTTSIRYIARLSYKTSVPVGSAKRLLELSGFSFKEFIPTAWELLPWSFLIDYFSNVGEVLEAFSTPTDNIYSITRTVRQVSDQIYLNRLDVTALRTLFGDNYVGHKESGGGFSSWIARKTSFQRSSVPSLDLPRLKLENPFGKNGLNRSLNILALSAGAKPLKPFYR